MRCGTGKVNPDKGGTSPADCRDCKKGFYCPEVEAKDESQCSPVTLDCLDLEKDCPKGFYCEAGVTQPTA